MNYAELISDANLSFSSGNFQISIEKAKEAIRIAPNESEGYYCAGKAYMSMDPATLIRGFTIAIVGVLEIFLIAGLVFNEKLTNSWVGFCTAYVIVALSALTIGFTIGFIFKKSKTALMAMMVAIYPVMFLSDATIPLSQMPSSFQKVAPYINPVYHMNILLRNSWNGDLMCKASYKSVTYLLVWVVAMLIIAKLCYRREE